MPRIKDKRGRKPGFKHSLETRNKIAQSLSGKPLTEERKRRISAGRCRQLVSIGIIPASTPKEYQRRWNKENSDRIR